MPVPGLTIALEEEIGNPELFMGREQEMAFLLDWVERVKKKIGDSHALLARKRRGKTALLQRFYNILYTRADPKVIPFFFRAPEYTVELETFSLLFFKSLITQYLAFKQRNPKLIYTGSLSLKRLKELAGDDQILVDEIQSMSETLAEDPDLAWNEVRELGHRLSKLKDERIIQIIDEFQFMNQFVTRNGVPVKLCSAYQKTAESKISPQIVSGSHIGWLDTIIRRMVGRYSEFRLGPLPHHEAMALIYNYARVFERKLTPEHAAYLAELCDHDPYYISRIFKSPLPASSFITPETARKIMAHETRLDGGEITKMWGDYILSAIDRINDRNAKRIVLFLAKHEDREFTRDEIRTNLKLDLTDAQLETRMEKLVKADILARGSSMFQYRGLGDRLFELVFRRLYEKEIEDVDGPELAAEFETRFSKLKGQLANTKGQVAEQKVRYYLAQAGKNGLPLNHLGLAQWEGLTQNLGPFKTIDKLSLHPQQDKRLELDLYAGAENENDPDLGVEVKNWERPVGAAEVQAFIQRSKRVAVLLERPIRFIFYSENGFTRDQVALLAENGILACDQATLLATLR